MRPFRFSRIGLAARLTLVLVLLALAGVAQAADTVLDSIVVTVNGKIITRYELEERLRPVHEQLRGRTLGPDELRQVSMLRSQALEQMIDDILILQDAERYKLKVTDVEVDEQIKVFREKRKLDDAEFKKQLDLLRITLDEFKRNMRRDIIKHRLIGGVVTSKVVVTDTEVEQQYNARKAEYSKDSMVQLALILLPAGKSATELKAAIESGQMTFAQAADKFTQGPGAGHGGDIGFIAWKDLAPGWGEVLRGLKPGQVAEPIRVQDFEGLLQVVSTKEGEEIPLEAVRDQIYNSLHEGKFEKVFQDYMKKQREKAVIEYKNV